MRDILNVPSKIRILQNVHSNKSPITFGQSEKKRTILFRKNRRYSLFFYISIYIYIYFPLSDPFLFSLHLSTSNKERRTKETYRNASYAVRPRNNNLLKNKIYIIAVVALDDARIEDFFDKIHRTEEASRA